MSKVPTLYKPKFKLNVVGLHKKPNKTFPILLFPTDSALVSIEELQHRIELRSFPKNGNKLEDVPQNIRQPRIESQKND